jgi:site-specific DNA recombinase
VRIEEAEAACVTEMFALYLMEGQSLAGVVKHVMRLGIPNPSGKSRWSLMTVRGMLTNPTYTATIYAGRERTVPKRKRFSALHRLGRRNSSQETSCEEWIEVGQVPALVTKEQFEMVQAKLAHKQSFAKRNNTSHQYLLRAMGSPWALWPLVQRTVFQDARLLLLPWKTRAASIKPR